MAGEKLLTEMACKALKPGEKVRYLNDGGGLRLRCRPDGSKTWIYRYKQAGKENNIGLGVYPIVTLAIARNRAAEARSILYQGKNPSIEKKLKQTKQKVDNSVTFGAMAREWIEHNQDHWSLKHRNRNEGLIRLYLEPDLGRLPIQSIEESYLFSILKPVYDRGRKESARRSRGIAAQIFTYARSTHRCTNNPAKDMADNTYFKKPPVTHLSAIPQKDIPGLVKSLLESGKSQRHSPQTVCALLLVLYTGLRSHSVRGAKWKEFNLSTATWLVPKERMKSRKAHQIPLPSQAVKILEELKILTFKNPDDFVFGSKSKYGYLSENTLRKALHSLGYKNTVHGFRSLLTDVLNENGFNSDAIERQLDHEDTSTVRKAYLRSQFMKERTQMMQWFADWCDRSHDEERYKQNVVKISAAV